MSLTLMLKAEVPLFVHLVGLALWLGAALAGRFIARAMHVQRDWPVRGHLVSVSRGLVLWGEMVGAALSFGSGATFLVFGASLREVSVPNYVWVKLGLAVVALVGSLTAFVCLRKAAAAVDRSNIQANAFEEDRFDRNRRGYSVASALTLVALLAIVVLSTVRPPW